MAGGLLQLAAYGAQDIYLTGNPQITFFVSVYRRYTNFAIENIRQNFYGNADFGQKVYCQIEPIGDLIHRTYLRVKLPSLKPYSYTDDSGNLVKFFWVNSIGHALIKTIEIEIGGVVIDRQFGIWLEIWGELTVDVSKRDGYNSMIGKAENPVNLNNDSALDLWIPLQFWFNRFIGQALPLIALQDHEVRINVAFRELFQLIVSSTGEPFQPKSICQKKPGVPDTLSIQEAFLDVDYIFLEDEERKKFAKNNHQYLIEQVQVYATQLTTKGQQFSNLPNNGDCESPADEYSAELFHRVILDFNHPMKELIWVFQNTDVLSLYPYGGNEWFNFSTRSYQDMENSDEPMKNCKIVFEGKDRIDYKSGKYFRTVVPYQYHTNTPNNYIYCYSFSNNPQEFQPSGSCNFSRIDDQELYLHISNQLNQPMINVFGINYNILNIAGGMAGLEYSS
jgi:hypothetical protein